MCSAHRLSRLTKFLAPTRTAIAVVRSVSTLGAAYVVHSLRMHDLFILIQFSREIVHGILRPHGTQMVQSKSQRTFQLGGYAEPGKWRSQLLRCLLRCAFHFGHRVERPLLYRIGCATRCRLLEFFFSFFFSFY